jgi:hypothetical protein
LGSLGVRLGTAPDAPTWEQVLASSLLLGPRSRFRTVALRYCFGRLIFLHTPGGLEAAWPIERKRGSGGTERWPESTQPSIDDALLIWMQRESALVTGPRFRERAMARRWESVLMADKCRTLAWQSRQAAKPGPPVAVAVGARPWKDLL